jgi:hypothetical protein
MAKRSQERKEKAMTTSSDLFRLGGLGAMLGGGLFVLLAFATASMPRGCIAEECAYRPMRESLFGGDAVFALLFIAAGAVGLVVRARHAGRFGRLGWAGLIAIALGIALLAVGVVVLNLWDSLLVPAFVISGGLFMLVGFLLMGLALLMARVLPPWAAVLLVVGTLAMLGFNDQDWRALMAVPFGLAWVAVGYALWSDRGESTAADTGEAENTARGAT